MVNQFVQVFQRVDKHNEAPIAEQVKSDFAAPFPGPADDRVIVEATNNHRLCPAFKGSKKTFEDRSKDNAHAKPACDFQHDADVTVNRTRFQREQLHRQVDRSREGVFRSASLFKCKRAQDDHQDGTCRHQPPCKAVGKNAPDANDPDPEAVHDFLETWSLSETLH